MRLNELISTSTYPYTMEEIRGDLEFRFDVGEIEYFVVFEPIGIAEDLKDPIYNQTFSSSPSSYIKPGASGYELGFHTGEGSLDKLSSDWEKKKVFKIFGTIEKIVKEVLDNKKPDFLVWDALGKRKKIYRRMKHPNYESFIDGREEGLLRK